MERVMALHQALTDLGIPVASVAYGPPAAVRYAAGATPAQITQGDALAATWDFTPRRPRSLYAIWQQLNGLTAAQQNAVWANVTAGSPPRWATDAGPNAAGIMALHWSAVNSGATAANLNDARRRLVAMYAQDNPGYLVNPAFDPSISVPGDEPAV